MMLQDALQQVYLIGTLSSFLHVLARFFQSLYVLNFHGRFLQVLAWSGQTNLLYSFILCVCLIFIHKIMYLNCYK